MPTVPKEGRLDEVTVEARDQTGDDTEGDVELESDPVVNLVGGQQAAIAQLMTGGSAATSTEASGNDSHVLDQDASTVPTAESVAAIDSAQEISGKAIFEGDMTALEFDSRLEPLDRSVPIKYRVVLGDGFHLLKRIWTPMHHEFKKAYFYALTNALFQWDPDDMERVCDNLRKKGWTDRDIESVQYYRPSFFRKRVRRIILPPNQLYYRIRAVFVTFGDKVDSKSKKALFNTDAWNTANNILQEVKKGYYSDPPGWNFYSLELDGKGDIKTDSYGNPLLTCNRGTNMVESIHKNYNTTFHFRTGIEMGDARLAERRHRHNWDRCGKIYRDFPRVGHYDVWKLEILQKLIQQNWGYSFFSGFSCVGDYADTEESFVTVPLHDKTLDDALKAKAAELGVDKRETKKAFDDEAFISRAWNVPIPFLPEFIVFRELMQAVPTFNEKTMALRWIERVDGVNVYPKLPVQLKKYHKLWKKSRRVQDAMDDHRKEIAETLGRIERFVANADSNDEDDEEMPAADGGEASVAAAAQVTFHQRQALRQSDQEQAMNSRLVTTQMQFTPSQRAYLFQQQMAAMVPAAMPTMLSLELAARQAAANGNFWVGNLAVRNPGPTPPEPPAAKKQKKGRGPDLGPRKERECGDCQVSADVARKANAKNCPGVAARTPCPHEPQN
ncbi:MAG: hypothetical protein SGARI_001647 [Bacillariaceae sp.]